VCSVGRLVGPAQIRIPRSLACGALLTTAVLLGPGRVAGQQPFECPAEDDAAIVFGSVLSQEGRLALPGALVTVVDREGRSRHIVADGEGMFVACEVAAGVATVSAAVGPFVSIENEINVQSGVDVRVDLEVPFETGPAVGATRRVESSGNQSQIRGILRDQADGHRVVGATVALSDGTASALTDGEGVFVLTVPSHDVQLRIDHVAYGSQSVDVELAEGESVVLDLRITPRAVALEPITVEVTGRQLHRLAQVGFYERQEWGEKLGLGIFLDQEDIRRRVTNRVSSILDGIGSLRRLRFCDGNHCLILFTVAGAPSRPVDEIHIDGNIQSLGRGSRIPCPMDLYVDGVPVRLFRWSSASGPILVILGGVDDFLHVSEVAAMEVYRRPSELPADLGGATDGCGAISVWTG